MAALKLTFDKKGDKLCKHVDTSTCLMPFTRLAEVHSLLTFVLNLSRVYCRRSSFVTAS